MSTKDSINVLINEVGTRITNAHNAIDAYNASGFSHKEISAAKKLIEEAGDFMKQVQIAVNEYTALPQGAPALTTVGGVHYALIAPLNPAYKPGVEEWTLGHADGSFCFDPGKPPGARSPAGYPLSNGRVIYNGLDFSDDAAVAAYIVAEAQRDANLAAGPTPAHFSPGP